MSFRKVPEKSKPTLKDLDKMREFEGLKREAEARNISPEHLQQVKDLRAQTFGDGTPVELNRENFKKISDMDPKHGIVIHDPVRNTNVGYLDACGDLRQMTGQLHPATEAWLRRVGKL